MPPPTHCKRASLSSDTTHSLPVYAPAANADDDRPPDYPDSAEEADRDTDSSGSSGYVPPPPPSSFSLSSPRRRRFTSSAHQKSHRRRQSGKNSHLNSSDPFLDSLLARSVHALEMSNTLLQSSMSTHTALATVFADSPADELLENSARGLSRRIDRWDAQPKWADDLAEISRGVDGLFAEVDGEQRQRAGAVSCSLPTSSSSPMRQASRQKRRPSMLEFGGRPHLHLSHQERSDLVAPPTRALTQHVGLNAILDPASIFLSSTLGAHASASSLSLPLHTPLSSSKTTETLPEPATPAYNILSSFVSYRRSPSVSTSASSTPAARTSPLPTLPNFFSNISRRSLDRTSVSSPTSFKSHEHENRSPSTLTPKQIHASLPQHRPMTPPAEEPSSCSSSSDNGCLAKRTVLSLRKILDEQPPSQPKAKAQPKRLRAPAFLPRTPAPVAEAGTSTATASISRLYTKAKHTSSTRPPSPPLQSAMKQPQSRSQSMQSLMTPTVAGDSALDGEVKADAPAPAPASVFHFPALLGMRSWSAASLSSATSSGRSTPKRISFAELPESYKGSGSARSGRRERKRGRGSGRRHGRGRGGGGGSDDGTEGEGGWWSTWFLGGDGGGAGLGAREERIEERLGRSWGGRMPGAPAGFGPGADEWAI